MARNRLEDRLKQNMMLFKPAIVLMNRLKYPQKFFLISLLFVLPLALVMNLLMSELNSRVEFTQKEIYGNAYLRPISQLWQYIPQRQLILQNQFYRNSQGASFIDRSDRSEISQSPQRELQDLQNAIDREFANLEKVDRRIGGIIQTGDKLKDMETLRQDLQKSTGLAEFRNQDLVLEKLDRLRAYVVDFSNLILDPDLDTFYLMDASAVKLPEMQKVLNKMMRTYREMSFAKETANEKKTLLISLLGSLDESNNDLTANLERAFKNNRRGNLRNSLNGALQDFVSGVNEAIANTNQIIGKESKSAVAEGAYQQTIENTLKYSFTLSQQIFDRLDELLMYRIQAIEERKLFISLFVLIIFMAIAYLFVGFYLSVMRTVYQLDIASKLMTSGNAAEIELDSKDELSMVVRSFNKVAIALRESEEKYRSIFENSVDGIFQTSPEGKYLSVNLALAKIYGYESVEQMVAQLVDVNTQLYVDPDRRQQFQALMDVNDTITNFESQVYKRDRNAIWISENVRVLRDQHGRILYYEGTVEDISQRKLAEIALEKANQQIIALNERLKQENLRMSSELEVTRKLQEMILPKDKELAMVMGLDIAGFMEPAAEVGGDYYDVLQQNGRIKIGIGDVTGHGLESGMLMIMVQTAVRTLLQNEEDDPVRFLDILNRTIYGNVQRMDSDKNLTLSLIDYDQGKLTLSGQHEEMIVVRKNGYLERFDTIDLGFPIGLEEEIGNFLAHKQIHLSSGDVVVLYTDGITEAENEARKLYGVDRLCEVICQNVDASAIAIRQAVIEDLRSHIGKQKIYDDITLLVLKQK
ncbi:SpoIIE family protein phosphatase [Pseudanabaena sp. UWO310]|uniref:SpoIIE family protein phosphatase n=1 Tax=Pseudanabaena sp. UWO310 TaxID=2480795 RepID=UPI00115C087F|nr:SpoIIE family protein phosphatase [Pseudanabaena sp. UWO310]TYQ31253.1 SpoIIE family protein phosphatase [Pseudanabaena sp. UWO310]